MIKTRTARLRATIAVEGSPRGRPATRSLLVLAAASLTAVGFMGMADVAAAQPVPANGTIVLAPHTDPEPEPGPIIANPAPQPQPDPAPQPADLPIAQPEPDPQPPVDPDLPIAQPTGHGDPEPDADLPIANPEPEPGVDPQFDPDLPIAQPQPGCTFTHGCPGEDTPTPDGHCFDDAGEVVDPSECMPTDDGKSPEVEGSTGSRGSLPRTGAGIAVLGGIGAALVAAGSATKRLARR